MIFAYYLAIFRVYTLLLLIVSWSKRLRVYSCSSDNRSSVVGPRQQMNYPAENPSYHSRAGIRSEELDISIPNHQRYSEESVSNKWNNFFLNNSGGETDVESSDSGKSFRASYASSSCSSTSLEGLKIDDAPEQMLNTDNSPAERNISLVPDSSSRKSDRLCQRTFAINPTSYEERVEKPRFGRETDDKMETSRLDDINENHTSPTHTRQPKSPSRLNVEDFDNMDKLKISNTENGMLKSVKGTVRGYKNMVRRYSASFNSKGHVIPPTEQGTNDEAMRKIIIYTTSMTAVRSTTDACSYVKKVFLNRGIPFEERDVFIHKEHQKEMQKRLGKHLTVPQVIINGNHIGGLKEIEEHNETGTITTLVSGFERYYGEKKCETCGGRNFINCLACGGSKTSRKHRIIREICSLRCTACNENGLIVCPDCSLEMPKE